MSDGVTPVTQKNASDDEKDDEQETNVNQKKEDAKVEKELDRVTDRVDDEEIGSENIGNVKIEAFFVVLFVLFFLFLRLGFINY